MLIVGFLAYFLFLSEIIGVPLAQVNFVEILPPLWTFVLFVRA